VELNVKSIGGRLRDGLNRTGRIVLNQKKLVGYGAQGKVYFLFELPLFDRKSLLKPVYLKG
jgi:hypothetical protein